MLVALDREDAVRFAAQGGGGGLPPQQRRALAHFLRSEEVSHWSCVHGQRCQVKKLADTPLHLVYALHRKREAAPPPSWDCRTSLSREAGLVHG